MCISDLCGSKLLDWFYLPVFIKKDEIHWFFDDMRNTLPHLTLTKRLGGKLLLFPYGRKETHTA